MAHHATMTLDVKQLADGFAIQAKLMWHSL
jgi:hypothetical protein